MSKANNFYPDWINEPPKPGTYRSIVKYGAPDGFKHPNRRLYALLKEELQLSDEDFTKRTREGHEKVTCDAPTRLSQEQIAFFQKIIGEKNVSKVGRIEFKDTKTEMLGKQKLIKCLTKLSESSLTPPAQKTKLKKMIQSAEAKEKINEKIYDIVYKYNYLDESMIEQLQEMDTKTLTELVKEASYYYTQQRIIKGD